jgi:hypothetical protein
MVVPMQKNERLLAKHNENRVTEFGSLGKYKEECPESKYGIVLAPGTKVKH